MFVWTIYNQNQDEDLEHFEISHWNHGNCDANLGFPLNYPLQHGTCDWGGGSRPRPTQDSLARPTMVVLESEVDLRGGVLQGAFQAMPVLGIRWCQAESSSRRRDPEPQDCPERTGRVDDKWISKLIWGPSSAGLFPQSPAQWWKELCKVINHLMRSKLGRGSPTW